MMRFGWYFLLLGIISGQAGAFSLPLPKNLSAQEKLSLLANPNFTANYNFSGILSLSNCSGSLVRFDDSEDTDKALVLTNGHCVSMIDPGKVITNQKSSRSFGVLSDTGAKIGTVYAQNLVFATMTDTDMSLYQLTQNYAEIKSKYNTEALVIARDYANIGDGIDVISGYWKRGFTCQIDHIVFQLKEGNWLFKDSLRYSNPGCETYGGTSGSPVVLTGTKTVVGVNNTGNESGGKCSVNNPCEIDEDGVVTYKKGLSYGQQINALYTCRDEARNIDLKAYGCLLPKPLK